MIEERASPGIPAWVQAIGTATWVTGPDLRFRFANEEARRLLAGDLSESDACFERVRGGDTVGGPFCRAECELFDRVRRGERLEHVRVRVGEVDGGRWVALVVVPIEPAEEPGPWLVHIASDIDQAHRREQYLTRIAFGPNAAAPCERPRYVPGRPSPRELEILDRLSHHQDLHSIARVLHVSYATVRNHVQRLLRKLDAHSIEEAVALHLLRHVPPRGSGGGGGAGPGCSRSRCCRLCRLCSA